MAQSAFDATIMGGPPYFDDYDEAKRFLKVLFRPGRPLQSRELSQVQSILQNQIERFGRHVFQEGSVATGGSVTDCATQFIRITEDLTAEQKTDIVGKKLKSDSSTVNAVVIGVEDRGDTSTEKNDQFVVLCIDYITAGTFVAGESLSTYGIDDPAINVTVKAASTGDTDPEPTGTITNYICMDESIFFSNGYFVLSENVKIAAHTTDTTNSIRDFSSTTCSIGFDINKITVDADDDSTLNDPAFGFYNYNSPGADRFKITFTPIVRALSGSGDEFGRTVETGTDYIEIVRILNGNVSKKVKYPEYANLSSTLARRTFDESGNYTVTPFRLSYFKPSEIYPNEYVAGSDLDNSKVAISVSAGKAYLNGYEYEGSGDNLFILDKPRDSVTETVNIQNTVDHYDQNINSPTVEAIDVVNTNDDQVFRTRRRTSLKGLENIIGGQKRIYLLDINGEAVGTCYIQQVLSKLPANTNLVNEDSLVFQLFDVQALGSGLISTAKYISDKYVTLSSGAVSVPDETISAADWIASSGNAYEFFIWNFKQTNDRTSFRKGSGRYYYHTSAGVPNHSTRVKYIKNLKMTAFKSFKATATSGTVTFDTGGQGLIFARDNSLSSSNWSTNNGSLYGFNYEFTIMLTDVLSGLAVQDAPFATSIPEVNRNNFNFNQSGTSLTISGLKAADGGDYSGTVLISAPVLLDYGVNTHGEQKVVRKALNFAADASVLVSDEVISQDALNLCDSNSDGFLDGSDEIRLSKQFVRSLVSVSMGGTNITSKFKQREVSEQAINYYRGSESNKDNRLERGFLQLEPNESLEITGDLTVSYNYYPTATYGDGSDNDGEILIANSYAKDAGADSAQNPRADDIIRTPHVQAAGINFNTKTVNNIDFRGYEYVSGTDRTGVDSATSPQSEFNRSYTFGKDRDGGFLPVGLEGSDDLEYTGVFYQHIPHTIYLDEDRELRLFTGTPGLLVTDGFAELKGTQMRIADLKQYGFGMHNYDIGLEYYDNQRTTMAEINEIEKDLIENEKFDRLDALESKAYIQSKSAFPKFSPSDHGTFVDTFEDWSSAFTVNNPGFNSAIDPIEESLRPNFTNFYTSAVDKGVTGSNDFLKTEDNLYLPAGSTVDFIRTDGANLNEVPVTRTLNPNGIIDFHGHASATPFTDAYWNTLFVPAITPINGKLWYDAGGDRSEYVHPTFGDVFKKNGNGVNYRDHELQWYGMAENSVDPNDITIDGSESMYTRRLKPKSIRRFLKARPTRKANVADSTNDRLVDNGLKFRGRNYTVTVTVHGLKPNTTHGVYQTDDTGSRSIPVGRGRIAFFTSDGDGSKTFTFEHPEVFEGIEYYLITDAVDSTTNRFTGIANSTSSADFFIYNTGLYPTEEFGIKSIRPMKPRRDASNLGTYENRYYENIPITSTVSYNAYTPLTQTFTVDAVGNPHGIFMESIDLYFKQLPEDDEATLPVTVRVHPVIDGVPNYNIVLPFAEKTAKPTAFRETYFKDTSFSRFVFTSPLYLQPGSYAFTVESNDPEYVLHTATGSQAVLKPENVGELYVPSNNGESEAINNEFLRFRLNRLEFNAADTTLNRSQINFDFTFADYAGGTASGGGSQWQSASNLNAASYYIANAPRLFANDTDNSAIRYHLTPNFGVDDNDPQGQPVNPENALGGNNHQSGFNKTLDVATKTNVGSMTTSDGRVATSIILGVSKDKKVCNVVDADRLGIVAQRFNVNTDDGSGMFDFDSGDKQSNGTEVRPTDNLGRVISRYYSKEVVLEAGSNANDLVVNLSGSFPKGSRPMVLAKVGKTSTELFQSPYYVCTFNGSIPENGDYVRGDGFPTTTVVNEEDVGETIDGVHDYSFRIQPGFNSAEENVLPLPENFTRYQLKILLLGGEDLGGDDTTYIETSAGLQIKSLSAVAGYSSPETRLVIEGEEETGESYIGQRGYARFDTDTEARRITLEGPFPADGTTKIRFNLRRDSDEDPQGSEAINGFIIVDNYNKKQFTPFFKNTISEGVGINTSQMNDDSNTIPLRTQLGFSDYVLFNPYNHDITIQVDAELMMSITNNSSNDAMRGIFLISKKFTDQAEADTVTSIAGGSTRSVPYFDAFRGASFKQESGDTFLDYVEQFPAHTTITLAPGDEYRMRWEADEVAANDIVILNGHITATRIA